MAEFVAIASLVLRCRGGFRSELKGISANRRLPAVCILAIAVRLNEETQGCLACVIEH